MYKDYDNYRTYENDDLSAGATLKVEHTIIVNETDILNLISQPLEKIQAMRDNNVKKETAALHHVPGLYHDAVDCIEEQLVQAVCLQKMAEFAQRCFIRNRFRHEVNAREFPH